MSAPRKIWANVDLYDTFSGKGICGEWNHCDVGSADDTVYHHDDVVRELIAAADRLVNNPGWGTVSYTDDGMWADGEALRAALAKIAQEDKP